MQHQHVRVLAGRHCMEQVLHGCCPDGAWVRVLSFSCMLAKRTFKEDLENSPPGYLSSSATPQRRVACGALGGPRWGRDHHRHGSGARCRRTAEAAASQRAQASTHATAEQIGNPRAFRSFVKLCEYRLSAGPTLLHGYSCKNTS